MRVFLAIFRLGFIFFTIATIAKLFNFIKGDNGLFSPRGLLAVVLAPTLIILAVLICLGSVVILIVQRKSDMDFDASFKCTREEFEKRHPANDTEFQQRYEEIKRQGKAAGQRIDDDAERMRTGTNN